MVDASCRTPSRKQELICGTGVPLLKSVGEACVNHFSLISRYVSIAASASSPWMPTAHRISACWMRSAGCPSALSR